MHEQTKQNNWITDRVSILQKEMTPLLQARAQLKKTKTEQQWLSVQVRLRIYHRSRMMLISRLEERKYLNILPAPRS